MFRKLLICIFFLALTHFSPQKAFAALYINEFSSYGSEWVEIYNSGSTEESLSGYIIRDSTDVSSHKIDLSGVISAGAARAFDYSVSVLNDTGDKIRLIKVESGNESVVEEVSYGSEGSIPKPESGQTAGRTSDGGGTWAIFSSGTKNESNNSATPISSPTPTPTNTPEPSKTPTPTKTPTPGPTSTPTKSPMPTPTKSGPTPTSVKSLNPNDEDPTPTNDPNSSLVIGESGNDIFNDASPTPEAEVLGASTGINIPWVFLGLGLIFITV